MRSFFALACWCALSAHAYTGVEAGAAVWTLYSGASIVQPRVAYRSHVDCALAIIPMLEAAKASKEFKCRAEMIVRGTWSATPLPPFKPTPAAEVEFPYTLIPKGEQQ